MAVLELGKGRYEWGVVALLLLSRCADDWVRDGVVCRPTAITKHMSIRAISQSLNAPYTTIHRYVVAMEAEGLIVSTTAGAAISNDPAIAPSIVAYLIRAHDNFIRLIEDLAPDLDIDEATVPPHPSLRAATITAALNIWLVPFEVAREPVMDLTSMLVWIAIMVANVRHITTDERLSRAYEVKPTPDELRKPIHARQIAAMIGLSYGTTFRHCQKLAKVDVIRYDRGGWLLAARQLSNHDVDAGTRAVLAYYFKRIAELVGMGLRLDSINDAYIGKRPGYVPLPAL